MCNNNESCGRQNVKVEDVQKLNYLVKFWDNFKV